MPADNGRRRKVHSARAGSQCHPSSPGRAGRTPLSPLPRASRSDHSAPGGRPHAAHDNKGPGHSRAGDCPVQGAGIRHVVPVLAFACMTVAVMQTLLVPVIKDLPVLLSTSPANATW